MEGTANQPCRVRACLGASTRLNKNCRKSCGLAIIADLKSPNVHWNRPHLRKSPEICCGGRGRLCGGDLKRNIRIDVWDQDTLSQADQIGLAEFPVEKFLNKERITLIDYKVSIPAPSEGSPRVAWKADGSNLSLGLEFEVDCIESCRFLPETSRQASSRRGKLQSTGFCDVYLVRITRVKPNLSKSARPTLFTIEAYGMRST